MPVQKKKRVQHEEEFEPVRRGGRSARADEEEATGARESAPEPLDELEVDLDMRSANEPDPREVDSITERIFGSVLSRYGWERHGSRIEHVGEQAHPRH